MRQRSVISSRCLLKSDFFNFLFSLMVCTRKLLLLAKCTTDDKKTLTDLQIFPLKKRAAVVVFLLNLKRGCENLGNVIAENREPRTENREPS